MRFSHQFDVPVEPGEPVFVAATVALAPDQLPGDDARHLAVPVVAALPVMFVDQYGATGEDPNKNRYGETFHLRRLLAPLSSRTDSVRQLISIRHVTPDQVERQYLEDCRLVVVAGIENPASLTPLLREYPNVLVIDVGEILHQVQSIIEQVARAVEFVFLFTLLAGVLVLEAAIAVTQDERRYETAILRTLGASPRSIMRRPTGVNEWPLKPS